MRNLNIFKALALFSAVILVQAFSASGVKAAECTRTNGEIDDNNFTTGTKKCTVTPDLAVFPLLKIGLCEKIPTYANYLSNCKFILEYATAEDVQIAKGSSVQLKNNLTLNEGTYKAAVLVIGNTIGLKHSDIFETDHNGQEADGSVFYVSPGKYCSTRKSTGNLDQFDSANGGISDGEVSTLESFLICDDEAIVAGLYTEDRGAYFAVDEDTGDEILCSLDNAGAVVAPAALETSNATVGTVQICALAADGVTPEQPGVQQLAIQTLPKAVVINSNTSFIDVGFELTNMLQFEQHNAAGTIPGNASTTHTFTNAFVESVGLKITTK